MLSIIQTQAPAEMTPAYTALHNIPQIYKFYVVENDYEATMEKIPSNLLRAKNTIWILFCDLASSIRKKKQSFCTIMATGFLLQPKALKEKVCGHYRPLPSKFTKSQSLGNLLGRGLKRWPPSMYFISMLTFKEVEAIQLNIVYENTCLVVL